MAHGCGAPWATKAGTKKIPPPMTFDTTMAAPSSGPSLRTSVGAEDLAGTGDTGFGGSGWDTRRAQVCVTGCEGCELR